MRKNEVNPSFLSSEKLSSCNKFSFTHSKEPVKHHNHYFRIAASTALTRPEWLST